MKIYKKIFIIFIVIVTVLGLVAFSFPARDFSKPQSQNSPLKTEENFVASINPVSPASTSTAATSSVLNSAKTSFEEMFGFSDLGQESDLVGKMGTGDSATGSIDKIFEELNQ
ncbi:MAG: hypothetical protein AAB404_01810 [Patescibacteria group bacterium]